MNLPIYAKPKQTSRLRDAATVIFIAWALRAIVAILASYPLSYVAQVALGGWPRGDGELFVPGGLMLLEVLRVHWTPASALVRQHLLVIVTMSVVSLGLTTMIIVAMSGPQGPKKLGHIIASSIPRLVPTLALWCGVSGAQIVAVGFWYAIAELLRDKVAGATSVRAGDIFSVCVIALGVLSALLLGMLLDLSRCAISSTRPSIAGALSQALDCLRTRPVAAIAAYWARGAVSIAAILSCIFITHALWGRDTTGWVAAIAVQQSCALALTAVRASWFARAVELIQSTTQSNDGITVEP